MKRILSVVLCIVMLFALCACGEKTTATKQETASSAPASADASAAAAEVQATPDPSSTANQTQLIFSNLSAITSNADYSTFYFTVTDLDHNGRLEVISAVTESSNNYTRGVGYEVNSTFDSLSPLEFSLPEGQGLPEIVSKNADTYYDSASNSYYYIFNDNGDVNSTGHYLTIDSLCLKDGIATVTPIAYQDVSVEKGITVYTFTDGNGSTLNLTSLSDFQKQPDVKYSGFTKSQTSFNWVSLANITSSSVLDTCYATFAGQAVETAAPVSTATPVAVVTPAPVPTIQIVDVNPVITKNPTSESLYEGGSCKFVAQANAYNYMAWSLVDPNGNVYGATTTPYSQLGVDGASSPCLTLSNVPLAMNGWRARATFYGATSATTSDAYIYVSSAPVVVKTVTASPGSGSYFTDYSNIVYLYSSTGENIHYEAIKSCDTGAYASENIASGSPIYITGISGQCIYVEVYANVVGSDKTSYFSFTVDCAPAPVPTYVPGPTAARGTLGQQETMSTVPIYIDGGTYYVSLDNITPQGSDLYAGRGCTCYYYGSYDNIYSVVLD